jgi:signal peptidase II
MTKLLFLITTIVLAFTDIGIKTFIESNYKRGEEKSIFKDKVKIRKVYNQGAAFNLFDNEPEKVRKLSCYLSIDLFIYYVFTLFRRGRSLEKIGLTLMNAGAWSNTFDRWLRGYVVDYVGFNTKWNKFNRLTFNIGDFFIMKGAILMIISSMLPHGQRKNKSL